MEDNTNTSLAIASTDLSVNLFRKGVSGTQKITSLDMTDEVQQNMYLKSRSDAEFLKDHVGEELNIIGVVITEREMEHIDEDTGEVYNVLKHSMTLFADNGKSYVTGSNRCYNSLMEIVSIKRHLPSVNQPMVFKVAEVDADIKGHKYLILQFISE